MAKANTSFVNKLILFLALATVIFMLATPVLFFNYNEGGFNPDAGVLTIWGAPAILGIGGVNGYRVMQFSFNWTLYITLLVIVTIGFTTYFLGPKARGYYIFAALVFIICAIVIYVSRIWLVRETIHIGTGTATGDYHRSHLGVGPWAGGLFSIVAALACLYEFKTAKLR